MKNIITLTTDFGTEDGFVGAMKGVVYEIVPEVTLVDISHEIPRHDIRSGAFCLWNSMKFYKSGTVHLGVVDPGVGSERRPLLIFSPKWGHFFVGPDNGIFSFVIKDDKGIQVYHLNQPRYFRRQVSRTFHGRDIFAPVAAYCSKRFLTRGFDGSWWGAMGQRVSDPQTIRLPDPVISDKNIEGEVIHIDRFGNCITNITEEMVEKVFKKNELQINVTDKVIGKLNQSYAEGKSGEVISLIGGTGFLEIALHNASAKDSLSIDIGCQVLVLAKSA
jgi:S-adenosylmethionine hydrolase